MEIKISPRRYSSCVLRQSLSKQFRHSGTRGFVEWICCSLHSPGVSSWQTQSWLSAPVCCQKLLFPSSSSSSSSCCSRRYRPDLL